VIGKVALLQLQKHAFNYPAFRRLLTETLTYTHIQHINSYFPNKVGQTRVSLILINRKLLLQAKLMPKSGAGFNTCTHASEVHKVHYYYRYQ